MRRSETSDRRIALRAGLMSAELAPDHGGRLSILQRESPGGQSPSGAVDLVPPIDDWLAEPRRWPKAGAYPLFPYSNRIRDGLLRFDDRTIALRPHPASMPHALHGPAHLRPWRAEGVEDRRAELVLDYAPDADWPWAFQARQVFELSEDGLMVRLTIRNDAKEPAPAGIGWHPYLKCWPDSVVQHDAGRIWRLDGEVMTDGRSAQYAGETGDNLYLSEWTRAALVHPDGSGIAMEVDAALGHLILHRPPGNGYVCIEPISHLADGFNWAAAGVQGTGLVVLDPGETLSGTVRLTLLSADG